MMISKIWWFAGYKSCLNNPLQSLQDDQPQCRLLKILKSLLCACEVGAELSENQDTPFYTWVWYNCRLGHLGAPVYGFSPAVVLDVFPFLETHPLQTHNYCSLTSLAFWDNTSYLRDQMQETDLSPLMSAYSTSVSLKKKPHKPLEREPQ